jgi:hypothetical protein
LVATAREIHANGGLVRTVRTEIIGARFVAGQRPLNGQAVADLLNDGWLIPDGPRDYRMDVIPSFAVGPAA